MWAGRMEDVVPHPDRRRIIHTGGAPALARTLPSGAERELNESRKQSAFRSVTGRTHPGGGLGREGVLAGEPGAVLEDGRQGQVQPTSMPRHCRYEYATTLCPR